MNAVAGGDPESKAVGELLAEARAVGVSVFLDGERLVIRGPRSAEGLGRQLLGRKAEVAPLLQAEAPAGWDQAKADAVLAEALALVDAAAAGAADVRRRVLEVTRGVLRRWHGRRDPLLWGATDVVKRMLGRWRVADAGVAGPEEGAW
jgi:hypothetical protein